MYVATLWLYPVLSQGTLFTPGIRWCPMNPILCRLLLIGVLEPHILHRPGPYPNLHWRMRRLVVLDRAPLDPIARIRPLRHAHHEPRLDPLARREAGQRGCWQTRRRLARVGPVAAVPGEDGIERRQTAGRARSLRRGHAEAVGAAAPAAPARGHAAPAAWDDEGLVVARPGHAPACAAVGRLRGGGVEDALDGLGGVELGRRGCAGRGGEGARVGGDGCAAAWVAGCKAKSAAWYRFSGERDSLSAEGLSTECGISSPQMRSTPTTHRPVGHARLALPLLLLLTSLLRLHLPQHRPRPQPLLLPPLPPPPPIPRPLERCDPVPPAPPGPPAEPPRVRLALPRELLGLPRVDRAARDGELDLGAEAAAQVDGAEGDADRGDKEDDEDREELGRPGREEMYQRSKFESREPASGADHDQVQARGALAGRLRAFCARAIGGGRRVGSRREEIRECEAGRCGDSILPAL